jgi:hypothetical protein
MRLDPMFLRRYPLRPALLFRNKTDLDWNPSMPPAPDSRTAQGWPRQSGLSRENGSSGKLARERS